jgi:tetratricopeptide (TPR) repeat protein
MNNTLQHAMSLLNLGEYSKVVDICVDNQSKHPSFELMLAVAYGKLEDYPKSYNLFNALQTRFPNNPDIFFNHALIAKQDGIIEDAIKYFRKSLQINGRYHQAEHALGNIRLNLGSIETALIHFQSAVKINPTNPDYRRSLASTFLKLGHYREVLNILTATSKELHEHATDMLLRLEALYRLKYNAEARRLYRKALEIYPQNAKLLFFAGLVEIDEKKFVLAEKFLQRASSDSSFAAENFDLKANTAFCRFMLSADVVELERIKLLLEENSSERAYIFTCNVFETYGDIKQAQYYALQGLNHYPDSQDLKRLEARTFLRLGDVDSSVEILLRLAKDEKDDPSINFYELAKCYESIGNYEFAAKYIIKANESEQVGKGGLAENNLLAEINPLSSFLKITKCDGRRAINNYNFVFIIGFPRSGTTLLESRIANVKNVTVLEETNAIKDLYSHISELSKGGNVVEHLNNCSQLELNSLADEYFQQLRDYVDISDDGIVVDKMPMNGLYTLLIKTLFPRAKIVLAIRDPRDVCISCLKQPMIKLHSVGSFAVNYDQYFQFLCSIEKDYPDTFVKIKYENLVCDFDSQFSQLLRTLGIKIQQDEVSNTGSARLFNTPSYHQVVKPIYKEAINAFSNYQQYFDFENPLLQKWRIELDYV